LSDEFTRVRHQLARLFEMLRGPVRKEEEKAS
jgi:hypothetical protein